jgi:hypothetical protein
MASLSFAQLQSTWLQASQGSGYHSKAWAVLMAAIAEAESSGRPDAVNLYDNNGTQSSFGLWQISNGTHAPPAADWANPVANARLAIGKLESQGLGAWGTYTSGAYKSFLNGVPSSSLPTAAGSGSGGAAGGSATTGAANTAQLTSFNPGDLLGPLGGLFGVAAQSLGSVITSPADIASSVTRLAKDFNTLVSLFNGILHDLEWLFVPSHWIRIFAFGFGIIALAPGVYALMKVGQGQQGDITMAIGILLITIAGVLLFIAFHNLPTDVTDLQGLLGYISQGIQSESAPAAAPAS